MFGSGCLPRFLYFIFGVLLHCFILQQPAFAYRINQWELVPLASIFETYDDNVTYARDNTKSDYITTASVGLEATYEEKTRSLKLSGRISQQFFKDNSGYDNNSEDLSVEFRQEFSPYERISVTDSFTHAEEPRSFEDEFGRTAGRYSYYRNRLGAQFTKDVTREFSWAVRYNNEFTEYSRSDMSDSTYNRIGASAEYILAPKTQVSGFYDLSVRDFNPGEQAVINTLGAGCRQYFTSQLYLDGRTGFDFIHSYNDENYAKPFVSLELTQELDPTTRANIAYSKQYTTNASTQDLFDQWRFSAGWVNQLLPRLGIAFNGFYGEGTYKVINIKDEFQGASCGLLYEVSPEITATLMFSYSTTDSNTDDRDYDKNTVTLGLRASF